MELIHWNIPLWRRSGTIVASKRYHSSQARGGKVIAEDTLGGGGGGNKNVECRLNAMHLHDEIMSRSVWNHFYFNCLYLASPTEASNKNRVIMSLEERYRRTTFVRPPECNLHDVYKM